MSESILLDRRIQRTPLLLADLAALFDAGQSVPQRQ
jgi:hypothetical protein